ncbi:MAG: hypothetical protein ING26_03185 [Roseomonas sp.]|nr:hypothetical protein [Roseomonas sp.]
MKPQGIFDRVSFLEAKIARLERTIQQMDRALLLLGIPTPEVKPSPAETPRVHKMREICMDVCHANDVTLDELKGQSKLRAVAWPRQDAMRLLCDAGYSVQDVARFLGRRDRTTVLHGVKASRERLSQ